ncbi:MAG: DedA family protein [Oscillospiraceae bacterium]
MTLQAVQLYINQYGLFFLGFIIFLEYLNVPGLAAGIILPVAGIWVKSVGISFFVALLVSVVAAVTASWLLYYIGFRGGDFVLEKYLQKFPSHKRIVDKSYDFVETKGSVGVFLAKLVPAVRTIISLPAGALKMNFFKYSISSCLGIIVCNFILMYSGYFFGDEILAKLC